MAAFARAIGSESFETRSTSRSGLFFDRRHGCRIFCCRTRAQAHSGAILPQASLKVAPVPREVFSSSWGALDKVTSHAPLPLNEQAKIGAGISFTLTNGLDHLPFLLGCFHLYIVRVHGLQNSNQRTPGTPAG
jgi:hypothetical protein